MEYVRLGRTGLKVSRLILGCMTYGDPKWSPWVLDDAASRDDAPAHGDRGQAVQPDGAGAEQSRPVAQTVKQLPNTDSAMKPD